MDEFTKILWTLCHGVTVTQQSMSMTLSQNLTIGQRRFEFSIVVVFGNTITGETDRQDGVIGNASRSNDMCIPLNSCAC